MVWKQLCTVWHQVHLKLRLHKIHFAFYQAASDLIQLSSLDDQCVKLGLSLCWYGAIPEKLSFLPSSLERSCNFPHRNSQRSERYLHNTQDKTYCSFWHNFVWPDLIISACLSITCCTWAGSRLPTTWCNFYAWCVAFAYMGTSLTSLFKTICVIFSRNGVFSKQITCLSQSSSLRTSGGWRDAWKMERT